MEDTLVIKKDNLKQVVGFMLVKFTLAALTKEADSLDPDKLTVELIDFIQLLEKRV